MSIERSYKGSCFCGAVEFTVSGEPAAMGYCHCESCRHWSAGPVNAFTLWKPDAVQVTRGADNIGTYNKTPRSYRKWCKTCGGHLFTDHPEMGLIDVYAAVIPDGCYLIGAQAAAQLKTGTVKAPVFFRCSRLHQPIRLQRPARQQTDSASRVSTGFLIPRKPRYSTLSRCDRLESRSKSHRLW